jgi:hypothetical protein
MQSTKKNQLDFELTNTEPKAMSTDSDVATIYHLALMAIRYDARKTATSSTRIKRLISAKAIINMTAFLLASAALFSVGCSPSGPKTYQVRGRVVTESGKPVEMGSVEFRSEGSDSRVIARGKIKTDGSFALSTFAIDDGAIAGRHDVIVQQMIIAEGFGKSHEHGPRVPASYSDYGSSGLTAEVKKSDDNFVTLMIRVSP